MLERRCHQTTWVVGVDDRKFEPTWHRAASGAEYYVTSGGTKVYKSAWLARQRYGGRTAAVRKGVDVAAHHALLSGRKLAGALAAGAPTKTGEAPPHAAGADGRTPEQSSLAEKRKEERARFHVADDAANPLPSLDTKADPKHALVSKAPVAYADTAAAARWSGDNRKAITSLVNDVAGVVGSKQRAKMKLLDVPRRMLGESGMWSESADILSLSTSTVAKISHAQDHGMSFQNEGGIKTLTHELMHVASAQQSAYEFKGANRPHAALEEATTEILAHHYSRDVARKLGIKVTDSANEYYDRPLFNHGSPPAQVGERAPPHLSRGDDHSHTRMHVTRGAYQEWQTRFADVALLSRGIDTMKMPRAETTAEHKITSAKLSRVVTEVALAVKRRDGRVSNPAVSTVAVKYSPAGQAGILTHNGARYEHLAMECLRNNSKTLKGSALVHEDHPVVQKLTKAIMATMGKSERMTNLPANDVRGPLAAAISKLEKEHARSRLQTFARGPAAKKIKTTTMKGGA